MHALNADSDAMALEGRSFQVKVSVVIPTYNRAHRRRSDKTAPARANSAMDLTQELVAGMIERRSLPKARLLRK